MTGPREDMSRGAFAAALLLTLALTALLRGLFPAADPPWNPTVGVVESALAVGAADGSTTHDLTMPTAGSLPKKSLVQRPVPLSVFEIHALLAPYRTVAELVSVNH